MKTLLLVLSIILLNPIKGITQTPQDLKSWLPPVDGWTIIEEIEVFNAENLFNRINGAAPLFLENNFQEMTSMVYIRGEEYITIQAYRHATPEDAFGMYASERSSDLAHFSIGGEAQGDNQSLYFFAGSVYVKMNASRASEQIGETMREIGKGLSAKIDPEASYPALFNSFPKEGKVQYSEMYTTSNYIGHEFLKRVYSCTYDMDGTKLQLFIIDGQTTDDARTILTQYFAFTKQKEAFTEGKLVINDRYNGKIPCVWKGRYITGVYSESGDESKAEALLELRMKN